MLLLVQWLLTALVLVIIAYLIPGIYIEDYGIALAAILVMSLINLVVRPLILLLTLPINILTLGLFTFVINAAMFALAAWIVPGFIVDSFLSALLGSLLLSLVAIVFNPPRGAGTVL